jgi:hypothetical protein
MRDSDPVPKCERHGFPYIGSWMEYKVQSRTVWFTQTCTAVKLRCPVKLTARIIADPNPALHTGNE